MAAATSRARHFRSRRAWCWPAVFATWPTIEVVALHTEGGGATMTGENPISVRVSGGHGALAVRESSIVRSRHCSTLLARPGDSKMSHSGRK
jgi:hypothetical protein